MITQKKPTNAGKIATMGTGAVGGVLLWAYTNLGVMFFALLALILLNVVIAAWKRDLLSSMHNWIRVGSSIAIPALVPLFANNAGVVWNVAHTHVLMAIMFGSLFAATIPDLNAGLWKLLAKLHVPQSEVTVLKAYVKDLETQIQNTATQQSQTGTTPASETKPPSNPAQQ